MTLVVHVIEGLAVARGAAVVGPEDGVAVVDEMLDQRPVAGTGLSTRSAMDQNQPRHRVVGACAVRLVENRRNLEAVEARIAYDLADDQVLLADLRVECVGKLTRIAFLEIDHVDIRRRIVRVDNQCQV